MARHAAVPQTVVLPAAPEEHQVPRKKAYYVDEAAELLSLGKSLVQRLLDEGHLHGKRIYGRVVIADAELDRFLADPGPIKQRD